MSAAKHTPQCAVMFAVDSADHGPCNCGGNVAVSRDLIAGPRFYEQEFRRLSDINAALLAALEAIPKACEDNDQGPTFTEQARAAIARARGQS